MADPDCELCALMGYNTCDVCGDVVFTPSPPGQPDLCYLCRVGPAVGNATTDAAGSS